MSKRLRALTQSTSDALVARNNNMNEGVIAFGLWLSDGERRDSPSVPISMKEFHQDRAIVLVDNMLQREVTVRIVDGVPFCSGCRSNDCMHVGFAICAEQMKRRSRLE
jgi:hypothetical protein